LRPALSISGIRGGNDKQALTFSSIWSKLISGLENYVLSHEMMERQIAWNREERPVGHHLQLNQHRRRNDEAWDPDQELAAALTQRARFLDKHPQHRSLQREIDGMLDKAGSAENRMAVLAVLIESKLIELHGRLKQLNGILIRIPA
jgi:hypothetical protein